MKFTKKHWIATISICAVVCGGCIFASIGSNINKGDINNATGELANDVLGGSLPDIDVKWELREAMKQLETETEVTTTTPDEEVTTTEITTGTTVADTTAKDTNNDKNSNTGGGNNSGSNSGSSNSSKPSKSSNSGTSYPSDGETQEGVLYRATVVQVMNANRLLLQIDGTDRDAFFKFIAVSMPEDETVENILEYIPEDEVEDIDGIRQMILEDDTIDEKRKQEIRVYDVIRNKLREGDTVYVEFGKNKFPCLPSDKDYYIYLWYYNNDEDRANDRLTLMQEWLLNNGYGDLYPDGFNNEYLDYFRSLRDNANANFTGLWNGYFKLETSEEKMKKIKGETEPAVTEVSTTENVEEVQTTTTVIAE